LTVTYPLPITCFIPSIMPYIMPCIIIPYITHLFHLPILPIYTLLRAVGWIIYKQFLDYK